MNFHLEFSIGPFQSKINYRDNILLIGSCFSEEIGERMKKNKMNAEVNPGGLLFNPDSICTSLKRYIIGNELKETDLFYANEVWNSWEHHSSFSDPDKQKCLNKINEKVNSTHQYLGQCKWLFITLGSSYSYIHNASGISVGNCHKVPQKEFTKRILSVDLIVEEYKELIEQLKKINSGLNIVFTISPVRYIRDGVIENNLSKAVLIQAVHELIRLHGNLFYFPSYELVIDDLRDYRFYKTDLVHPNEQAVNYVFEKLMLSFFDSESKLISEKLKEIIIAGEHKVNNEKSEAHKKFKKSYFEKIALLQQEFPFLNLTEEMKKFI
jgi:hypothetical protein